MKDTDYNNLLQFKNMKGAALIPHNAESIEFLEQLKDEEIATLKNVTARDIKLHRGYFLMLAEVWGYLPKKFKNKVPKEKFYNWLKMYEGNYTVIFEFKDGRQFIEYNSISFGRMDNHQFRDYVKTQIPTWYELFQSLLPTDFANSAIETIEDNFEKILAKL